MPSPPDCHCGHSCFHVGCIDADGRTFDVWECRALCGNHLLLERERTEKQSVVKYSDNLPVRACTVPRRVMPQEVVMI